MTSPSSEDNELVVPESFREHVILLLGERRAELVLNLAAWMVEENPEDLLPVTGDPTLRRYSFSLPWTPGDEPPWVIEFEKIDNGGKRFSPTRIYPDE